MKSVDIVIGANYGDEGKGQVTDYLASKYLTENPDSRCIVILCNGGSQRGHTVTTFNKRHVFHHFGSGTYAGAETYMTDNFILNPITFREEYEELESEGSIPHAIYINPNCMFTTPFDMMVNQILEISRGEKRRGSCGYGIWETVCRYKDDNNAPRIWDISRGTIESLREYLISVRDFYIEKRLESQGYPGIPEDWKSVVYSEKLLDNYLEDMSFLFSKCVMIDESHLMNYDHLIFEMGQGLMLEATYAEHIDNSTPSFTGLKNPMELIDKLGLSIPDCNVYFVTRSYLTRHGAGYFEGECSRDDLCILNRDKTNVPNDFQGVLRYAPLSDKQVEGMLDRIYSELSKYVLSNVLYSGRVVSNLVVTHVNEVDPDFLPYIYAINPEPFDAEKSKFYVSDDETRESIKIFEGDLS